MLNLLTIAQQWLIQYLPSNNTRQITATNMRNVLLNAMPRRLVHWVQGGLTYTISLIDLSGFQISFDIVMEMSGDKVVTVPVDFPERFCLTIVNTSLTGDITFTLPGGVYQYGVNQVFTVRPNTASAVTEATLPSVFRGSASFVRLGNGKWYIV